MDTNTYGASNFKHKTNFGPIVVFADDEQKMKPFDDFEPSWNQYIPIYQNEETGQWFAKPHQMMSGEYGDFIIRSKGILPEGSIHANRITFFLSSEQEPQYGDLEMYYYRIDGELYLQASATIELDEVVVIANSNNQDNEEVNTEQDETYNVISSDNSDVFVTVFVSDDGAKLERAYQQIDAVKNRELVLFVEKNDSTNFFGSVFRVLSGKQITESSFYPRFELSRILRAYTDIKSLNMEALSDLITQHFKDRNDKSMFLYLAQKGVSFIKVASKFTLEPLGNIMYDIADEIDKELKIGDDRWQVPKDGEGDYNPLLPGYNVLTNEQTVEQIAGTINKNFINPFSKEIDTLIVELKTNTLTKHFIGNRLDNLSLFVSSIPEKINEIVTTIFEFFKKSFEFFNALLVGIINSLVDLLKSIFEILGLIFKGLHAVVDQMSTVVNKVKSSLSFSLESLENMISVLSTVFTTDNLIAFIGFQVYIIKAAGKLGVLAVQKAVSFFEEGVTVTLPYDAIGYYTGYVVGWIAQEVVMFMLTAGTGTLAKGIQGAVKSYTDLAKAIGKAVKNTANKAQRAFAFTVDNFLKAIQALKNFAKQIPKHLETLKSWIDELIASLKSNILLEQTVRLQSKFPSLTFILIDEALSLLKLVLKGIWKTELDDVGLKFAKTEDGGMAFVYKEVELFKDNLQAAKAWLSDLLNKEKRGGRSLEEYLDELVELNRLRSLPLVFGKNKLIKYRKHAQQLRKISKKFEIDIPQKIKKIETQVVIDDFIKKIIKEGDSRIGDYMTLGDCIFTKLDDAIVIRKLDGEFVTFLDYSLGGVAKQWDNIKL
jgi:hypothetical protein